MSDHARLEALFQDAKQWHQQGDLDRAEAGYRDILDQAPGHAGALQFIGVLAAQRGDISAALGHLTEAVARDPMAAGAWFNLGRCYLADQNPTQAIAAWQKVLTLDPKRDDARFALVPVMLAHNAHPDQILAILAPKLRPPLDDWRWLEWAARCYLHKGDFHQALEQTDHALRLGGDPVTLGANKANLLCQLNKFTPARQLAEQILTLAPDHIGARTALGWASLGLEDHKTALAMFAPLYHEAPQDQHLLLGYVLAQIRFAPDIANQLIEQWLDDHPNDIDFLQARGGLLIAQRDFAAAVTLYRDLIPHHPHMPTLWQDLGLATEQHSGTLDAMAVYQQALGLFPGHAGLRFGLARCALACGDGATGWAGYEARFGHLAQSPQEPGNGWPVWNRAEKIDHLLIYSEQGIGDCFQFLRYLALVPDDIPRITLLVPQSVHVFLRQQPLLRHIHLAARIEDIPAPINAAVSLLSLPCHLTPNDACLATPPYLYADPARIGFWQERLARLPAALKIGLNWQGSKKYGLDDLRSPPLRHFERWLDWPDVTFINLQQNEGHEQLGTTAFGARVIDWTQEMDRGPDQAFVDTAALLCGLDLVITSDTALAHLAGGLGVATWLLTPVFPDWRWGIAGANCPWYPHMRLFRQPAIGAWDDVAADIDTAWRNGEAADFAGSIAFLRGDFARAIMLFRHACAMAPHHAEYRGKLALALNETGQYRALITESITLNQIAPDSMMARLVGCWAAFHDDRRAEALTQISHLRVEYPTHPSVAAAAVMIAMPQDPGRAGIWATEWLENHPDDLNMRLNLATTAARQCDWDRAIAVLAPALPDPAIWLEQLRYYGFRDGAVASLPKLEDFLGAYPDHPDGVMLRAQYRLACGADDVGWRDYEARLLTGTARPACICNNLPAWDGMPNPSAHILIDEEQGIGDIFQYLRFLPLARARVGRVSLRVRPALIPLLQHQPCLADIDVIPSQQNPVVDGAAAIMSLPFLLGIGAGVGLPAAQRLAADPQASALWAERLRQLPQKRKIGLNWQGSPGYSADYLRSIPLAVLSPLAALSDCTFVNLHQGSGHHQIAQDAIWQHRLVDWTAEMDKPFHERAFIDSAALLSQLDLFITSDTALAHLAGILGVPTWLMVSARPDWRWGLEGTECPWYPTMRLFRQPALGDWESVIRDICQQLSS